MRFQASLTSRLFVKGMVAISCLVASSLAARAQTPCDPSTSPANADNYFSRPETVRAAEPFYEDVHICGVPSGTSIRVQVAFVSATTGLTVFSNQARTDINGVAPVYAPNGLPADSYNLIFSSPDVPNLTTGPGSGFLIVLTGNALSAVNGLYVFIFQGVSAISGPAGAPKQTHIIGSFIADGTGKITSGEADINSPQGLNEKVPLTGLYLVDYTNRGTLSLVSSLGTLSFSLSFGGTQGIAISSGQGADIIKSYESAAFTNLPGSSLIGTGNLYLANQSVSSPYYGNTALQLKGETACDAACLNAGGSALPLTVYGNLCLGCLPNTVADGPQLYRAVFSQKAGLSMQTGLVQTGSVGPRDAFTRSVLTVAGGNVASMPHRYAAYTISTGHEYLLSLDPHDQAPVVSGMSGIN